MIRPITGASSPGTPNSATASCAKPVLTVTWISATIPAALIETAAGEREIVIRLEVDEAMAGGLAIYGEQFGRYPSIRR
jgi:hypothetical protein